MMIALTGVMLIILYPILFSGEIFSWGEVEGNIFILLATFGGILHALLQKKVIEKIGAVKVTFISFMFGAMTFLPFAVVELNAWNFSRLNYQGWTGIIFGVFFSSALAYYLYSFGLGKIKAQETGLFAYIDPIVAVMIAVPLLGEHPSLHFYFGSILVFGGIYLAEGRIHWHPLHKLKVKN